YSEIWVSLAICRRLVTFPLISLRQKYSIAWFSVSRIPVSANKGCRSCSCRGDSLGDSLDDPIGDPSDDSLDVSIGDPLGDPLDVLGDRLGDPLGEAKGVEIC